MFLSSSRDKFTLLCSKTQWQIFLLVSNRHVGAHSNWLQPGVTIQISRNISPHILLKKNCCDPNLGEGLCLFTFFLFPDIERF